ncbi:DNA polymerase I [Niastella koreensis]|uniref:DNA polymerase I n=2 Tax=Niastella koreensis TaxID=354356 RepID=G8TCH4_NIAKG|nr:DNA polymerase I [Niastella koreensis]AEW02514.1 DNA polymerase I [Niastella koreensis GR20-10]OQP54880.1 DNA polymerase I [Niastella koreensis]
MENQSTEKKVFLLDALALIFRAYYALIRNPRITSKGKNTNAQFGFINTLLDLINNQKPTHMAVCFDTQAPTERHTEFSEYKANRQESPEDLMAAIPDIKRIIRGFNIPVLEVDGFEADDVIGTLSKKGAAAGYVVYMVTPDKDYGQLVDGNIKIYKPGYQGGDAEILGAKEVCEKWNIKEVHQVIDILGLMGDAVDNIPGIAGVGEKTAAKLLAEYGTLENVLENADKIKGALGEKVRNGRNAAILSKKLATIITDVPIEFHEEDFKLKEWNRDLLKEVFTELEFKTVAKRILGEEISIVPGAVPQGVQTDLFGQPVEAGKTKPAKSEQTEVAGDTDRAEDGDIVHAGKNIHNTAHQYRTIQEDAAIQSLIKELLEEKEICFDTETTGIDANDVELVGMSFSFKPGEAYYVPCPADQQAAHALLKQFEPVFNRPDVLWIGQNLKYDMLVLKWYGYELKGETFDTMLAHYVIEPDGKRSMDMLSAQFLGYEPVHIEELIGKKGKNQLNMRDVAIDKISDYAAEDADITLQLKQVLAPLIKTREVEKVFSEVENPLAKVLMGMEYEGVKVDVDFLRDYSKELEREAAKAEDSVYEQAGVKFNLASPRQLGEVLFERLKLDPKAKKTKTGQYATGEDVLLKLASQNKIVEDILAFRELTKLKSTYVDSLPELINRKTGRVHTSYAQAVAVTGRLSSNNPNLQNIPVRTERGREIRKAFVPRDSNRVLISADYSQIELRIVAGISGDPAMCEAFKKGVDIHTATAAKVYGVEESAVTKEQRYKAKSVNFGIIYGQGAFGLADNLGISRTEAKEIIDNYKKQFAGIQKYMDDTINFARETGYVQTIMGRKRWLRDIGSSNFTVRGFAERNAINSPIQGTAADMIKLAMVKIYHEFRKYNFESRMILQVHDELVFDAVKEEVETIKPIILECMRSALPLPNEVPVEAEIGSGTNWLEAH